MDRDNVVVYTAWPVSWSGIWVGTLAALAVGLIIGLIGTAVGAHEASRYVDWKKVRLIGLVFSVAGAFFAFVIGGWVAARIAGITRSETAILVHLRRMELIIVGTEYAGEIKKSAFTVMNYLLPDEGVLPMHSSVNVGQKGDPVRRSPARPGRQGPASRLGRGVVTPVEQQRLLDAGHGHDEALDGGGEASLSSKPLSCARVTVHRWI